MVFWDRPLITSQRTTVDVLNAEDTVQLVETKLLLLAQEHGPSTQLRTELNSTRRNSELPPLYCAVLKYVPVASIIGW